MKTEKSSRRAQGLPAVVGSYGHVLLILAVLVALAFAVFMQVQGASAAPQSVNIEVFKQLLSSTPLSPGSTAIFQITVKNTGSTVIDVLPLRDEYDSSRLAFQSAKYGTSAFPPNTIGPGFVEWNDLTTALGNLDQGQSFGVFHRPANPRERL